RLHPLALRARARRDIELAAGVEPHGRALERADPGALDIAADPEAEMPAALAGRFLAAAKLGEAADRRERLVEGSRIVAAVVNHRLAVAVEDAGRIGHLVGADHVAPAYLGRFELELPGDQIDEALHDKGGLGPASAAIGRVRDLVGDGDPGA